MYNRNPGSVSDFIHVKELSELVYDLMNSTFNQPINQRCSDGTIHPLHNDTNLKHCDAEAIRYYLKGVGARKLYSRAFVSCMTLSKRKEINAMIPSRRLPLCYSCPKAVRDKNNVILILSTSWMTDRKAVKHLHKGLYYYLRAFNMYHILNGTTKMESCLNLQ